MSILGIQTIGASGGVPSTIYVLGGKLGTMSEDGTATSITACIWSKTRDDCYVKFALYLDGGGGLPTTLIAGSGTAATLCPKRAKPTLLSEWTTMAINASLLSGQTIWAVYTENVYTDTDGAIAYYDSSGWGCYGPAGGGSPYATFPQNPCLANIVITWRLSVFVTYTSAPSSNIKTYNTNVRANIKTINTNVIANVKTLNTNA